MTFTLPAQVRTIFGKKVRVLRKRGMLPAVLYGAGKKNIAISIIEQAFEKMRKNAGESSLIELHVDGEGAENALIHDVDYDPLTHKPRHVDFLRVRMDEKLRVAVPLRFEGESTAVKEGGILVKVMYEAEIEALPANLPHEIIVDLSYLQRVGDRVVLADLSVPQDVSFTGDTESVVALVEKPRAEEEAAREVAESERIESIEVAGGKKEKASEEEEEKKERTAQKTDENKKS